MKINGDMLVLAREYRGLTQDQAAILIGCAQSTIAKIEGGIKSEIDDTHGNAIVEKLGFPKDFFCQTDELLGFGSSAYFYRKRAVIPASERKKVHSNVNLLRIGIKKILPHVEIKPSRTIPKLSIEDYDGDPAKVARALRAFWNIPDGPIKDLTALVESAGVLVIACDFETRAVDATSLQLMEMPPLVFMNDSVPGDRWRYTLAHELAHLIMHDVPHEKMEEEADLFAGEFLVPQQQLKPQLMQIGSIKLSDLAKLKRYWKVSMAMLIMRAQHIGFLTQQKAGYLFAQMTTLKIRIQEPEPIQREYPSNLHRMIDALTGPLQFSEDDLMKLVNWGRSELERFFSWKVSAQPRLRLV